jgi:DNA mismatch endonuclease (patch repair protein)
MPKSRREFWEPKLTGNRLRDERVKHSLEQVGWRVYEVWECHITKDHLRDLASQIKAISVRRPHHFAKLTANDSIADV